MAEPRQARVLAEFAQETGEAMLALQVEGNLQTPLKGGKYIIINTGLTNAEGKFIKRAYSLFGVKAESQQFFLAAEIVNEGMASRYVGDLRQGDVLTFSGPWGRFHWPEPAPEKTLIAAAFGSGITGVLGYVSSVPEDVLVHLYWFRANAKPFLTESIVEECAHHLRLQMHLADLQDDPLQSLQHWNAEARFITAGEGTRAEICLAALRGRGVAEERLQSEIFYRSARDSADAKKGG